MHTLIFVARFPPLKEGGKILRYAIPLTNALLHCGSKPDNVHFLKVSELARLLFFLRLRSRKYNDSCYGKVNAIDQWQEIRMLDL